MVSFDPLNQTYIVTKMLAGGSGGDSRYLGEWLINFV